MSGAANTMKYNQMNAADAKQKAEWSNSNSEKTIA